MKIPCSSCNQRLEIPEELAGQTIECPSCNASLAVPAIEAFPPAPTKVQISTQKTSSPEKTVPKRKTAPPLNTVLDNIYKPSNSKRGIAVATSAILLIAVLSVLLFSGPSLNIWEAAKVGDIHAINQHLAAGTDVNAKDGNGWSPLLTASQEGHKEVAELLITKGADVNAKTESGWNTLRQSRYGLSGRGYTPLHLAANEDHYEVAELLIIKGADVNVKNEKHGLTPLLLATSEGNNEVVELLIVKGADVNAKDNYGKTPLDRANGRKFADTVNLLRKLGGKTSDWLNAGKSIHIATKAGHIEAIKQHLAAGVTLDVKTAREKRTPLHLAAREGHKEIIELLIAEGADVNATDIGSGTPLDNAITGEIVTLLREDGGMTGDEVRYGMTPLHGAARDGLKGIIELHIAKGADVNAIAASDDGSMSPFYGKTPLDMVEDQGKWPSHISSKFPSKDKSPQREISNLLRKHGGKTSKEVNALITAAKNGDIAAFKQHLTAGADVNAKLHHWAEDGLTALHVAAELDYTEIAELLIANGADVNAKINIHSVSGQNQGKTPLDLAIRRKTFQTKTAHLLRKHGAKTSKQLKAAATKQRQAR